MAEVSSGIPLNIRIERAIENSIRNREYVVGDKLPTENEYCRQFSASRTAVREALKSLNSRGLIDIRKGSGIYVTKLSTKGAIDLLNFYFEMSEDQELVFSTIKARSLFEPEIAAQAALHRSDEDLKKLAKNLQHMRDCPLEEVEKETALDQEFHAIVTAAARNPVVRIMMEPIFNLIPRYTKTVYGKEGSSSPLDRREDTLRYHTAIFEAIEARDSREAFYQMKESLIKTEKNFKAYLKAIEQEGSLSS